MAGGLLAERSAELRSVTDFLTSITERPSGLVIDGEVGIGKTTLWSAAVQRAQDRRFRVLTARAGDVESGSAYAVIAELINDVDCGPADALPAVQRRAMDRMRRRELGRRSPAEDRIVATTFLSILHILAAESPVLVAIDDVQWLDAASKSVIAFVARRLDRRIGLLLTEGSRPDTGETTASWLRPAGEETIARLRLGPLSVGGLHTLLSDRLGYPLPRPTTVEIAELSRGNLHHALELARAADIRSPSNHLGLPVPLAELVRHRMGPLRGDVRDVLLAAACASDPTVGLLAQATGSSVEHTVELLEPLEDKGIIDIQGNRVRFSHPLLARGVYADADSACRRSMHRTLADIESQPELRARHLALSSIGSDPATLTALDAATDTACARGAPAAAAELLDLARQLGGDTPQRRIRAAECHFQVGNAGPARAIIEPLISQLPPSPLRGTVANLLAEMCMHDNSFTGAVELLRGAEDDAAADPAVLVRTFLLRSFAELNTGEYADSLQHALHAATLAGGLGLPVLASQARANKVSVGLVCGQGVDEPSLQVALSSEDPDVDVALPFSASAVNALTLAWTGHLEQARAQMQVVRNRYIERKANSHIMFVDLHSTLIDVWRADFAAATLTAEDAIERAELLGGDHRTVIAHSASALVSAYTGRERDARVDARAAIDGANRCGSTRLADTAVMALGFLDVTLGNYAEALTRLQPLIAGLKTLPGLELGTAAFIPDAVEAMLALGNRSEAEPLIDLLEHNGRRLDRPWMLAVGARCRSMWWSAQGDAEAATSMAQQAMVEHDRLPMPFERARTQLLLGQLLYGQHLAEAATVTLREALRTFDQAGTPLWANRAREELDQHLRLTPSEQGVAELAASGMTNYDVAALLDISPKTVEANLTRIYRKLGIRSRAELGKRMSHSRLL
ncbi:helix-turn-helix transcriptional regulator [Mycolicibacterium arenosum]|uniref:AAA family ATPase n=1 Tax=Mycolicibacterium arenosum TaxID=2952157 RepID=A0ABT1M7Z1_9MYCO|nr:LuxR family transcriptional regulator [Mycolicibacterium sp. CAU 1645]MCP9275290.1 AAA family ATPase [Mycolicibacterium sp. CAU 1645]